jgi:diguanylate cyclase (GGDEF)-like protein
MNFAGLGSVYLYDLNIGNLTLELIKVICVLFTFTMFMSHLMGSRFLELKRDTAGNVVGIFYFALLMAVAQFFPIYITGTEGVWLDLRLALLTLASAHLSIENGLMVALLSIIARVAVGGIGWIWWSTGAFIYCFVAYIGMLVIRRRTVGLITVAVVNTLLHMSILALLSVYSEAFAYFSPEINPDHFMSLAVSLLLCNPLAVFVLDRALRNVIESQTSYFTLGYRANVDGLTGLYNSRHFKELFEELIGNAQNAPVSVLMLDVDYFKNYNDNFGHEQGDEVLRRIGETMIQCLRKIDVVGRYGGEEFVIALPQTDKAGACIVAERIRTAVESQRFAGATVTVSVGVATYPDTTMDRLSLISMADAALYCAKRLGRNRVEVSG